MGNILERFHSSLASSRLGSPGATTGTENGPFYSQRTCLGLPVLSNTTCWTRYVQKRVGFPRYYRSEAALLYEPIRPRCPRARNGSPGEGDLI